MFAMDTKIDHIISGQAVWVPEPTAFSMIRIGDSAEIVRLEGEGNITFKSKIVDIPKIGGGARVLSIYAPSKDGLFLDLRVDEHYRLTVQTKDYLISFTCSFEGYLREKAKYFAVIKILDEGIKLQRREFFRFTCMLAMKFSVMYTGDNEAAKLLQNRGYSTMYNGIIRDIGGGGIRFITNEDIETDSLIQCTIMLGNTAMLLKGKILDKQYMPKSNMQFQYRTLFLDVSQATQDEIVSFIFAEQRKQKKFRQAPPAAK
ncbi:MAG: PilZ domain-containing protein [Clostridiales bacterium]|jgi:c-di-GMP-binding flagellar brake protein YcgR|nr:PilZ domain-containing protein [Clostridiales bacterium]